jgi:hypothetical protein
MRLSLQNQPQIEALSQPLTAALRALVSAIQTGWNKQHKGDGTHAAVTADSLTAPVVRSQGRLIGSAVWSAGRPLLAATMPLHADSEFVTANGGNGFFNVVTFSTSGATPLVIHGISADGREPGERIVIANIGNGELELIHTSTSTPLGTRFMSGVVGAIGGQTTINSGGSIEAVLLRANNIPTAGLYWFLLGGEQL